MNIGINRARNSIIKQKKVYIFLIGLIIIGIISGICFWHMINSNDKSLVIKELTNFFTNIKNDVSINYGVSLINSILTNFSYVIIIWLLGISIIGLPIILVILGVKSFIVGFSISSIISIYGFKGILGALAYIFPHQICFLLLLILLGFYSISFCIKLFKYLFLKQLINFKIAMRKYLKILILSLIVSLFISLFETFISTYFIKLFTTII